jgi:hypothetical protein
MSGTHQCCILFLILFPHIIILVVNITLTLHGLCSTSPAEARFALIATNCTTSCRTRHELIVFVIQEIHKEISTVSYCNFVFLYLWDCVVIDYIDREANIVLIKVEPIGKYPKNGQKRHR